MQYALFYVVFVVVLVLRIPISALKCDNMTTTFVKLCVYKLINLKIKYIVQISLLTRHLIIIKPEITYVMIQNMKEKIQEHK